MKLIELLPEFWADCPEVAELEEALNTVTDKLEVDIADLKNQFFVDTATWGLSFWERMLRLPVAPEKGLDIRRSIIKTHLIGYGTLTLKRLESIISSYTNSDAEIYNLSEYTFAIKFISAVGIPKGIEDLKRVIKKIKPAHIFIQYEFKYRRWSEFSSMKWADMAGYTWAEAKETEVI